MIDAPRTAFLLEVDLDLVATRLDDYLNAMWGEQLTPSDTDTSTAASPRTGSG